MEHYGAILNCGMSAQDSGTMEVKGQFLFLIIILKTLILGKHPITVDSKGTHREFFKSSKSELACPKARTYKYFKREPHVYPGRGEVWAQHGL